MKRAFLPLLLVGLLVGCGALSAAKTPTPQSAETPLSAETVSSENTLAFEISSPIQFASYHYRQTVLVLECVAGSYDADRIPYGQAWSGRFRFRQTTCDGSNGMDDEEQDTLSPEMELSFNGPFDLHFIEIGSSGPLFVITQFGSTSGGDYGKLFSWREDDIVEEVPIRGDKRYISGFGLISLSEEEDSGCFLLPYRHTPGSLSLDTMENGFIVRTEDPFVRGPGTDEIYFMGAIDAVHAGNVTALEDIYLWDGSAFVLSEQRLLYENTERM